MSPHPIMFPFCLIAQSRLQAALTQKRKHSEEEWERWKPGNSPP